MLISILGYWVLLLFFTTHTYTHKHTTAVASQSLPLFLSIAFTCVTLHVLPWWSLMLPPPHKCVCAVPVWRWSRLVAGDAGRLQTSSLPLGRRPIFTSGHKVYQAAQHIYGSASNPSLPGNISPHALSLSLAPFISQKSCSFQGTVFPLSWGDSTCEGFEWSCSNICSLSMRLRCDENQGSVELQSSVLLKVTLA